MKKLVCILLLSLLLFAAVGCEESEPPVVDTRWPVSVGEVTISHVPQRIITLSPAMTETVFQLGYGGRLVGVSDNCALPEAAGKRKRCGTLLLPDTKAMLSLSPDLVIASTDLPQETVDALAQNNVPVLVLRRADSLSGIIENYKTIATAMQGEEQGALIAEQLSYFAENTLAYVKQAVSPAVTEGTSAVYLQKLPFIIATGDTLEGQWLSDLGFTNQAQQFTGWSYPLSAEPDLNPNYIFCDQGVALSDLQASDYYRRTSAVTNLRVYSMDGLLLEKQTPQMFLAWEEMLRGAFSAEFDGVQKPSIVLPMEPPPPPPVVEKSWWEKLLDR